MKKSHSPEAWKILLIDDEPDIREVIGIVLADAGYQVETAPDGTTGLSLCEKISPHIVITDIRMPGMDGLEVLENIKRKSPDIEVIVITAFGEIDLAIRALQLDASDFINKPINESALFIAIERAKKRFSDRRELRDYAKFLEAENAQTAQELADQTQMLHQDKMMSLGRLAASVVHEINNPLAGILNYIHLMQKILKRGRLSEADQEKFSKHLELIGSETSRCAKIISNLLSFSRSSRSIFKLFDIEELLNRCRELSQHKLKLQNIRFTVSAGSNLPALKGDVNQLQQCIINLIFNAADAMQNGGFLNVSADYDAGQRKVNIFIKDTGSGICESDLPHIFEPFFTTKKDGYGVGLGLSTVYGIIKRHNGNITVDSQIDKGSTFQIELPVLS
ncbi:MAG: response regulator [Dissulfuribacterales bacterium]